MAYEGFKDLTRRTASDKILYDKHLIFLNIRNMIHIKKVLLQWFINSLIKNICYVYTSEALATLKINWQVVVLKVKTSQTKNYTNQLLEKLKKTKNTLAFYKQFWDFVLADM